MKRFLVLAALVLGLASCQTEPEGLDVNVGGAVDTVITVNIPENETRAKNSGIGVFENGVLDGDATMRYIFQVYYNGETNDESRQVMYTDGTSVSFPVRLVPGRDYQFVVWADVVKAKNAGDNHYNTTNLENITLNTSTWVAMDETRDAFTATYEAKQFNGAQTINIDLYRPFAKLRVVTTDYVALANHGTGIWANTATVKYYTEHRSAFNAYTSKAEAADLSDVEHENYTIAEYTLENDAKRTIFSDYFFAENDVVKFEMTVYDTNGDKIVTRVFNTDIYAKRNHLTTLLGNILTDGNDINVEVKPGFGGTENPDINYNVITSGAELLKAIENGGSYLVGNDIYVSAPVTSTSATRGAGEVNESITTTINLNGKTIEVNNQGNAFVNLDTNDTLIFSGDGEIGGTGKLVDGNGTIVVTGTATVDANAVVGNVVDGVEALVYILANGGEFTMTDDLTTEKLTFSEPLEVKTTNPVVINGNGKTITYTGADRAFTVENTDAVKTANVTLNNLTFVNTASYCQRGINFNVAGKLTLNNVTVGKTGTPATYAINLPGSSDGAEVVINNSYFRGNIALNVWGENMTINATGSEFVNYDNVEEDYAAIMLNNDGFTIANGTTIYIDGGSVIAYNEKGELSEAVLNSTMTGVVTISDTTVVEGNVSTHVAVVIYEGQNEFYSCSTLKDAINKAIETKGSVSLLRDTEVNETLEIASNLVVNLNGKTVTFTGNRGFRITNPNSVVTIKNGKIVNNVIDGRCVETRAGGINLTLENVTLTATNGASQPFTVGGTGENFTDIIVNFNNSTVEANTGYGITTFHPVALNINNSTISGYAALNIKPANNSTGSAGSEIKIVNSTLNGVNNTAAGATNGFSTIEIEDNNIKINVDSRSTVTATSSKGNVQCIVRFGNSNITSPISDCELTIAGNIVLKSDNTDFVGCSDNQGSLDGNTVKFAEKYADELKAEGWIVGEPTDGLVTISSPAIE